MSSLTTPNDATGPADPGFGERPRDVRALARRFGRLALVGGLVWSGWTAASAWSDLLRPTRTVPTARDAPPLTDPSALIAQGLAGGRWMFLDGDRPVAVSQLPAAEADARVTGLAADEVPSDDPGPGDSALIPLLRSFAGRGKPEGPNTVYEARRRGVVLKAVTRGAGDRERLAAARLAIRWGGDGRWLVVETTGGPAGMIATSGRDGLLPLPGRARRVAVRADGVGRTFGEVVAVDAVPADLAAEWRRQGWSVLGTAGSGREPGPPWYCQKAGDAVQVWAAGPEGSPGPVVLVLVRDPGSGGVSTR